MGFGPGGCLAKPYENGGPGIDTVNGGFDHIHLLVSINPTQNTSNVVNLIKGESSNWINKNDFIRTKFAWQEGFGVFSVSPKDIELVRNYIKNQEDHHRKMTFKEEVNKFLKTYNITLDEQGKGRALDPNLKGSDECIQFFCVATIKIKQLRIGIKSQIQGILGTIPFFPLFNHELFRK